MATPHRIYQIYAQLFADAHTVKDFQEANGEKVSGTVQLLVQGDRDLLLKRWGEEIEELAGVLDGTHKDPYIMESTQCFYWASLFAVSAGMSWDDLNWQSLREQAVRARVEDAGAMLSHAQRLVGLGADQAKPEKCFLIWHMADQLYRSSDRFKNKWSIEEIMEADYQDMLKRSYLKPVIDQVPAGI